MNEIEAVSGRSLSFCRPPPRFFHSGIGHLEPLGRRERVRFRRPTACARNRSTVGERADAVGVREVERDPPDRVAQDRVPVPGLLQRELKPRSTELRSLSASSPRRNRSVPVRRRGVLVVRA